MNNIQNTIDLLLQYLTKQIGYKIIIDEEYFIEFPDFYYLIYNSEDYLINKNISNALVGNFPVIIKKTKGEFYTLIYDEDTISLTFEEVLNLPFEDILKLNILQKFDLD